MTGTAALWAFALWVALGIGLTLAWYLVGFLRSRR